MHADEPSLALFLAKASGEGGLRPHQLQPAACLGQGLAHLRQGLLLSLERPASDEPPVAGSSLLSQLAKAAPRQGGGVMGAGHEGQEGAQGAGVAPLVPRGAGRAGVKAASSASLANF